MNFILRVIEDPPGAFDGDAEGLAVNFEAFGGIGGIAVESPDAVGFALDQHRLSEPLAEAGGFTRAWRADEDVGADCIFQWSHGAAPHFGEFGFGEVELSGDAGGGLVLLSALDLVSRALGIDREETGALENAAELPARLLIVGAGFDADPEAFERIGFRFFGVGEEATGEDKGGEYRQHSARAQEYQEPCGDPLFGNQLHEVSCLWGLAGGPFTGPYWAGVG